VIPIALGLVARDGRALPLQLEDEPPAADGFGATERVLVLDEAKNFDTFVDVDSEPVPSLLRGFSAPVILAEPRRAKRSRARRPSPTCRPACARSSNTPCPKTERQWLP
jgi:aminopeptidase N